MCVCVCVCVDPQGLPGVGDKARIYIENIAFLNVPGYTFKNASDSVQSKAAHTSMAGGGGRMWHANNKDTRAAYRLTRGDGVVGGPEGKDG